MRRLYWMTVAVLILLAVGIGATWVVTTPHRYFAPGDPRLRPGDAAKGRLVGDVDYAEVLSVAGAITPVPGGVGPMTIACLLRNTLVAAHRRAGLADPEGF